MAPPSLLVEIGFSLAIKNKVIKSQWLRHPYELK
jgi:hypothetical protein